MAQPFSRPADGFRFKFRGMKTNTAPDACPPDKYPLVQNGRAFNDDEIRTRPGGETLFSTGTDQPLANVASYSQGLGNIRYLAASNGEIFQDDSATPIDSSFTDGDIQAMVPYRPNQSPESWIYVSDSSSNRKFSFPNGADVILGQKVGIAEPQAPVDACLGEQFFVPISSAYTAGSYSHDLAGGGGLNSGVMVNDTILAVFQDPVYAAFAPIQKEYIVTLVPSVFSGSYPAWGGSGSVAYPGAPAYSKGMVVTINMPSGDWGMQGAVQLPYLYMVRDVYPPLQGVLNIESIFYYSGTTGRCVIVPANTGSSSRYGEDLYSQQLLTSLRRGTIVQIGSEQCYVLSVTVGPDGSICFEVSTTSTRTTADTITGVYAIRVVYFFRPGHIAQTPPVAGQTIYQVYTEGDAGVGINTITSGGFSTFNPFAFSGTSFQDDDYIHVAIWMQDSTALIEAKILFDVDVAGASASTAFTLNFYYASIRPADFVNGIDNTLTQLGSAQLAAQRATIDQEVHAQGKILSSDQANPGAGQWSHIFLRISDFVRVGNDQTRNLMNINSFQFMFNLGSGAVSNNIGISTVDLWGGFSPDVSAQGSPLRYRIRPRSSLTGAKGNPSPPMRYGVRPSREGVIVPLPTTYSDPQVDTWDIFRIGGTLTKETFVGFVPIGTVSFLDNFNDLTISASEQLSFDDLEPWPSIDSPFNGTASIAGTTAIVTQIGSASIYVQNYLPGNKVQIGEYVYTLWNRPVNVGTGIWMMQFQENAGSFAAGTTANIYEPLIANLQSRMTWGPTDDGGVLFGLDPLRTGTVSFTKNFNPDSVPSGYNLELCPPSEPLIGGCYARGLCAVGSSARKWVLRPSFGQANQWTPSPLPGGGLASPFGMCTDGETIFAIEKNGITANGVSITSEDLSNLFPIDGVIPQYPTLNGVITPDFTKANLFRLACGGGYLYFNYIGVDGSLSNTLVYDIKRKGWAQDTRVGVCVHVPVIQAQSQNSPLGTNPVQLLMGDLLGNVYEELDGVGDAGEPITLRVITAEYTGGEARALAQWGDVYCSILPSLNIPAIVKARSGGADVAGATTSLSGAARVPVIVNTGNPILFSMGLEIICEQTFANGETQATLYIWQTASIPQPVVEQQRAWDWDNAGVAGNKFWQGFILEANTNGVDKLLGVRDADTLMLHPFTPSPVNFQSQSEQAFSFVAPFIAHSVRLEPQDAVNWNGWGIKWVTKPFPEACETWQTELISLGIVGWGHIRELNVPYISTAPVTLTLTFDDAAVGGPIVLTLPSTAGAQLKTRFSPTFNKWKLIGFQAVSTAPFYLFLDDFEAKIKSWGSQEPYQVVKPFGGDSSPFAEV